MVSICCIKKIDFLKAFYTNKSDPIPKNIIIKDNIRMIMSLIFFVKKKLKYIISYYQNCSYSIKSFHAFPFVFVGPFVLCVIICRLLNKGCLATSLNIEAN